MRFLPGGMKVAAALVALAVIVAGYWYVSSLRMRVEALRQSLAKSEVEIDAWRTRAESTQKARAAEAVAIEQSGRRREQATEIIREIYRDKPVIIREECHEDAERVLAPIRGAIDRLRDARASAP